MEVRQALRRAEDDLRPPLPIQRVLLGGGELLEVVETKEVVVEAGVAEVVVDEEALGAVDAAAEEQCMHVPCKRSRSCPGRAC